MSFFNLDFTLADARTIFGILDTNGTGYLTPDEIMSLFGERKETKNTMTQDLIDHIERTRPEDKSFGKYPKLAIKMEDILEYPHFFKQTKSKLANARKLQI
jgi:hypothetical protein